jgi:hypothetical protein
MSPDPTQTGQYCNLRPNHGVSAVANPRGVGADTRSSRLLNIQITNASLPYIEGGISTGGVYGTWVSSIRLQR